MKTCCYCHISKPEEDFYKGATACKLCKKEYDKKNKERIKEVRKADHLRNKERDNKNSKIHYTLNKDKWATNYQRDKEKVHEAFIKSYYDPNNTLKHRLFACKRRAKETGLNFELDLPFLEDLLQKQNNKCALTGINFDPNKNENCRMRPFSLSVDRIDSNIGYTKSNVRLVCAVVNFSLNEFGQEIFDKMCEAYIQKKREQL